MASVGESTLVQRHKRRSGVALSCNECRRLKLKCSRVFPCSNCVKKGLKQAITQREALYSIFLQVVALSVPRASLPTFILLSSGLEVFLGSLTTGKGNRFVLANTEVLHDKITELASRVRTLEDALADSHSMTSLHTHPLLSDELLQIKRPLERERLDHPSIKEEKQENGDTIDAMGSLSLLYSEQCAPCLTNFQNEESSDDEVKSPTFEAVMPSDIPWLAYSFPFASGNKTAEGVRGSLLGLLPKVSVAQNLCTIYYRHAAWMYTPITEDQFYDVVFRPVYEVQDSVNGHILAILYMALAIGTLLDLSKPSHSPEAAHYYQLGRAALSMNSIFEEQSIHAIQALLLMCHYMFLDDIDGPRWATMGLVVKLAQSVGLHRDSGKWKLSADETFRRRCLLWEIFTYDSWQSLTYGRPPSFSIAHVDTRRPHESYRNGQGEQEMSFHAWKHAFCHECLSVVHDQVFGARPPSYKTIQDMDKKVRNYYVPPSLQVPGFGGVKLNLEVDQPSMELTMQRHIAFAIKEISIFYMHRGFFARALEDSPADPMGSKYAPSVLAAYTSACSFVGLIGSLFKQQPALTERMWFLFTHVFSCSIVLGSIAAKSQMAIAPSAFSHLESAYSLFSSVSETSRKNKILPILQKLKERAHAALSGSGDSSRIGFSSSPPIKSEDDELAGLGGLTRLVSRKKSSSPGSPYSSASPVSQHSSPPPAVQTPVQTPLRTIPEPESQWSYAPQASPSTAQYPQYASEPMTESPTLYQYPTTQHSMPLESMHSYYGYQNNGTNMRSDYNGYQMSSPTPNEYLMPVSDIADPWQNFMAQYRPLA
ncbi:hypothetical protein VNI00_002762 [Paramarasmius palmivorus]|uniref:Zn(2)-C6 fungal-type domain-containing protein n=1 Tax=Paramarasmius palmivorus TaxID=297713 RepID=A0AAW0E0J9_9AGAR